MRILLAEDDPDLARQLKSALADAGYAVDHAPDGEEAQFLGETEPYDAVVLDLGLPKVDGVSVLERWRRAHVGIPVLILTARGAWSEKVAGFDAGADDYLTKPFHTEELLARLRALVRRAAGHSAPALTCGDLRLDPRAARASVDGEPLRLTSLEYRLLHYMMLHQGRVISRTELVEHLYDQDFDRDSNTIEVFVGRLRKKIGADRIETLRGLGYRRAGRSRRAGVRRGVGRGLRLNEPAPPLRFGAPPDPRRSLVGRLVWLAAGWCLLALALTGVGLTVYFERAAVARYDRALSLDADDIYAGLSVEGGVLSAPAITDAQSARPYSGKYWQIARVSADGRLHALPDGRSRSLWDADDVQAPPAIARRLARELSTRFYFDAPGPRDQHLRVAAMRRALTGVPQPVVILTALDRGAIDADIRHFALITAAALLVLGAGLVSAVILQVRVGLTPLFAMGREVARVREGAAERLTGAHPAELEPLASELNALLDHNREVVERQRTHVGNLAHALKTPLSVMLTEAGAGEEPLAEVVRRQAAQMREQVEHHLRRARASARFPGSGERTPVPAVMDELTRTLDRIYGRRGVDIDADAEADVAFLGERQDLLEMAGNLLENACKYCRAEVRARAAGLSGGAWRLVVEDDGPGLTPAEQVAALRRGQRLDESAPGSGLGLSIVDELARAYGGSLRLDRSDLGGLKVELTLPRAA